MHFFHHHHQPHHRWTDNDEHDISKLILELAILVIIFLLWPGGGSG